MQTMVDITYNYYLVQDKSDYTTQPCHDYAQLPRLHDVSTYVSP